MKKIYVSLLAFCLFSSPFLPSCQKNPSVSESVSEQKKEISLDNPFKSVYGVGEVIDFSLIRIKVRQGDKIFYVNGLDSDVLIEGGDTSKIGDYQIKVTYLGNTFTFDYQVRQYVVTLDFNGGTFQDKTFTQLFCEKNRVDLSPIIPEKKDENGDALLFSGWFYDKELTKRAAFLRENEFYTERDVTLYAGFDADYTDRFIYSIDQEKGEATILSINFSNPEIFWRNELHFPSHIENYPVTRIASSLFVQKYYDETTGKWENNNAVSRLSISAIVFDGDSPLEDIGDSAFEGRTSLSSLSLPSKVKKIGRRAFATTGITGTLSLPDSIEEIGERAFSYLNNCQKIEFGKNSRLKLIGKQAFAGNENLCEALLPDSLEEIKDGAFRYCSELENLTLPKKLRVIGSDAFKSRSSLTSINVDKDNPYFVSADGNLFSKDRKKLIFYCYRSGQVEYKVPDGVESIADSAFDCFNQATPLKKLTLPEGITYIGKEAFNGCECSLSLPSTLISFSLKAFTGYKGTERTISENNPKFAIKDLILYSKDYKNLYYCAINKKEDNFILRDSVTCIYQNAFLNCSMISSFVIPDTSHLETIQKDGIPLKTRSGLSIFQIDSSSLRFVTSTSFGLEQIASNESFRFVFKDNKVQSDFVSLFDSDDLKRISPYFLDKPTRKDQVKARMCSLKKNNKPVGRISYDNYLSGRHAVLLTPRELESNEVKSIFSILFYLYRNKDYTEEELGYYTEFEKRVYLSQYASLTQDYYWLNLSANSSLNNRFPLLPDEIQAVIKPRHDLILEKLPVLSHPEKQDELYAKILSRDLDSDSFNQQAYQERKEDIALLRQQKVILPSRVESRIYLREIDEKINTVLSVSLDHFDKDTREKLSYYREPSTDNDFENISNLISLVCNNQKKKNKIYRYQEFLAYEQKYKEEKEAFLGGLIQELSDFDVSPFKFSYEKYENFYNRKVVPLLEVYSYDALMLLYPEVISNLNLIVIDIDVYSVLHDYASADKDSGKVYGLLYPLVRYIDSLYGSQDAFDSSRIANLEQYKSVRRSILTSVKSYVKGIKAQIKSFVISQDRDEEHIGLIGEELADFGTYYQDELLKTPTEEIVYPCYGEERSPGSSESDDFDYYSYYYTILASLELKVFFDRYPERTKENTDSIKAYLFGSYDFTSGAYQKGTAEFIEQYLSKVSDTSLVLRYNEYIEILRRLNSEA